MTTAFFSSYRASLFGGLALACAAAVLVPACSGDETEAPSGGGPIGVESIRSELQKADCDYFVRCGFMPDAETCLATSATDQRILQLIADVVYGKATYDPAAARACVDAKRGQSCDALPSSGEGVETACASVFKGSLPEGGKCLFAEECAGESICDTSMCMGGGACCLGECKPAPARVPLGGDCSMGEMCEENAYCDPGDGMTTMPTCMARVDNGQPCTSEDACKEGQRCDSGGENKCFILQKEGGACNPALKTNPCVRIDNWCSTDEKMCVKLPGVGEPCTGDGRCQAYAYCDAMTCKARILEGGDCVPEDPKCLGALTCQTDEALMKAVCMHQTSVEVCVLGDSE